jgi:hypothetical protein
MIQSLSDKIKWGRRILCWVSIYVLHDKGYIKLKRSRSEEMLLMFSRKTWY